MYVLKPDQTAPAHVAFDERGVPQDIKGEFVDGYFVVDQSDNWLYESEKDDPDCYARRMQALGRIKLKDGEG
jgi:hypothetical protein